MLSPKIGNKSTENLIFVLSVRMICLQFDLRLFISRLETNSFCLLFHDLFVLKYAKSADQHDIFLHGSLVPPLCPTKLIEYAWPQEAFATRASSFFQCSSARLFLLYEIKSLWSWRWGGESEKFAHKASQNIGVARIFDWGEPKPQITCNDVIRNFRKRNFSWGKDNVEWKIWSRSQMALNQDFDKGRGRKLIP